MYLKRAFNLKNFEKLQYKAILFAIIIIITPSVFRFLDHSFHKLFSLNKFINVIDMIFIGFVAFCFIKKDQIRSYFSINIVFLLSFILFARLSILFSQGQIHHKSYVDLFKFSSAIFIFLAFLTPYFQKNQKVLIKSFFVIFLSFALFESIVGIFQFILQKRLGFSFETMFGIDLKRSAKVYFSQDKQFFLNFLPFSKDNIFLRAHGTFIHPNTFSGFLNISALLTLYLIYKSKKKLIYSLFLLLQIAALFFTFSRTGLASFFCSSTLFFFLMLVKKYDVKKMSLIFFSIMILFGVVFSKYLLERGFIGSFFQSKQAKELNIKSNSTRSSLKEVSINMIKKRPFWGVGFRNFLIKRDEYTNKKVERAYVHNIYLLILAEMGIFSFCLFLALLISIFIGAIRYSLEPLGIVSICIIVAFLLIGIFDHYPFSSHFGKIVLFFFLGFLNFLIEANKRFSYSQKALLYQ